MKEFPEERTRTLRARFGTGVKKPITVAELRDALSGLPDSAVVYAYSDDPELHVRWDNDDYGERIPLKRKNSAA